MRREETASSPRIWGTSTASPTLTASSSTDLNSVSGDGSPLHSPTRKGRGVKSALFWIDGFSVVTNRQDDLCSSFIFYTAESPERFPLLWSWRQRNLFNASMTYRLDSDIQMKYGLVELNPGENKVPLMPPRVVNALSLPNEIVKLSSRPKLVYWAVSTCETPSLRENFVHELRKHVNVS